MAVIASGAAIKASRREARGWFDQIEDNFMRGEARVSQKKASVPTLLAWIFSKVWVYYMLFC